METKNSMYILAIVVIVAIVGIIILLTGAKTGDLVVNEDSVGQVSRSRVAAGFCGDGNVNNAESCDGSNLNGKQCSDIENYVSGTLDCNYDCTYDTSDCELSVSVCGNGVKEENENCDGSDFGWLTCESYGFGGGDLICDSDCSIDTSECVYGTNATIIDHQFNVHGSKSYELIDMTYNYNMGIWAHMGTSEPVDASLDAQCHRYSNGQVTNFYTNAQGKTTGDWMPSLYTYGSSTGGVTFDGTSAWCYSYATINQGPRSELSTTFNPTESSYPSINTGAIYRNSLTNQYFVYFDAYNYNGGICKIMYYIGTQNSNQNINWEMELPNCPTVVSYLAPIDFDEPIVSGEQIWLSLSMRPDDTDDGIYTSGFGSFYFSSNKNTASSQTVKIQGNSLVPAAKQELTDKDLMTLKKQANEIIMKDLMNNK